MADDIRVAPSSEPSIPAPEDWKAAYRVWWKDLAAAGDPLYIPNKFAKAFEAGWNSYERTGCTEAALDEARKAAVSYAIKLGRAEDRIAELEVAGNKFMEAIAGAYDVEDEIAAAAEFRAALAAPSGVNTKEKV